MAVVSMGLGRPRHAGEDHAAEHVDVRQPAGHVPDERAGEVVDPAGDPGLVEDHAGQDEERQRQEREAVEPGGHALDEDHEGGPPLEDQHRLDAVDDEQGFPEMVGAQ
jgi:hypothetical protein